MDVIAQALFIVVATGEGADMAHQHAYSTTVQLICNLAKCADWPYFDYSPHQSFVFYLCDI